MRGTQQVEGHRARAHGEEGHVAETGSSGVVCHTHGGYAVSRFGGCVFLKSPHPILSRGDL